MAELTSDPQLRLVDLDKTYPGGHHALRGVSLDVADGEVVVIIGPSGCGKSTLLRTINGLEPINSGQILFDGTDLAAPGVSWPEVRRRIIGRHAAHGLDALDRLLAAGIEFHAQIVLMPDENDGDVLAETLEWAYARPGVLDVCIVPLGFTKHQTRFSRSFNDPAAARAAMERIVPFQERALAERGTMWAFAADEFYHNAYGPALLENLPPAEHYGDFGMFEDGVGIIRSFVDDWGQAAAAGLPARAADALRAAGIRARYVVGCATRHFLGPLVAASPLAGVLGPLYVKNEFFGGNVDVTGLLCGCDIVAAVRGAARQDDETRTLFLLPRVIFNDDSVTLDDMSLEDMEKDAGAPLAVVSCNASDFLREIVDLAGRESPAPDRTNL